MFQSFFLLLLLIIVANASPIITRKLLKDKWDYAIDFNMNFIDGQPLLGASKTWRGLVSSLLITSIVGLIFGYSISTGLFIALLAMAGDLSSSFIKRRFRQPCSSRALLLDQIPESLFPALAMMNPFNLDLPLVIILIILFILFELGISRILFALGIRKRPY